VQDLLPGKPPEGKLDEGEVTKVARVWGFQRIEAPCLFAREVAPAEADGYLHDYRRALAEWRAEKISGLRRQVEVKLERLPSAAMH
jgi:hypothetical protein